jgi:hypothetical protein
VSYVSEVLADSPTAYFRLAESTGNPLDSSGHGFAIGASQTANCLRGLHSLVGDPADAAWYFTDNNTLYVGITYNTIFDANPDTSVEMWFRSTSTLAGQQQWLAGQSSSAQFQLYLLNGRVTWVTFLSGGSSNAGVAGSIDLRDGNRHHVVGVRSGLTALLYVDGVLVGSQSFASMKTTQINTYNFGGHPSNSVNVSAAVIDEYAQYNSALSAARVLAHYNAALPMQADRLRDARLAGAVLSVSGSKARTGRLSMQVLSGPPQKMRTGRVSVQVLYQQPVAAATGLADGWGVQI